ncbi:uncharacterized protein [Misgurnus anguillicaudatus]|uniref:uncharacterized protein isoform X5 n=1 Tax=Misgurnus anguillicaudatus TaxID=75329 RepID=UPI003CCFCCFF
MEVPTFTCLFAEANAMVDSVSYMAVVALCNWKMIHSFACGILAQTVVCKHTDKIISSKRPSMMMSGSLSMMTECPSLMMSRHSSVMMSIWLSVMKSKCFSVSMPTGPLLMMSGCSLTTVHWRLSMMMSGRLSVMMSKCPSLIMSGGSALKMFGHNNEEFRDIKPDDKVCEKDIHVEDSCCEKNEKEDSHAVTVCEISTPKRYVGLQNQGATCYLNTVLQILFMTKEFREAAERYLMNNSTINNHIAQLFERLKSGERNTVTTEGITAELKINVHKQEDAAKCLQKILNVVDPKMSEIFQGIKVDTTTCINPPNYHKPLEQVKSFFILSISLESDTNINLQSCFNSYFKSISMRGEGQQIYCKDCKMMMDTDMSCSLEKIPSVLVLHLERFELDYDTMCCIKNYSIVQIPAQLCIEEQVVKCHLDKDLSSEEAYLILYKKSATDLADPSCHSKAEHQADLTKTSASVQTRKTRKRQSVLEQGDEVLCKKFALDSIASATPGCDSQETLHAQDIAESKSDDCHNPEKDQTNDDNNKDPVESPLNLNQADHQSDLTKTVASVQYQDLQMLSEDMKFVVSDKKFALDSIASADPCCDQDIAESKSDECHNPEKDQTNGDNNKDPLEPPLNLNQADHQSDLTKTSASVQYQDLQMLSEDMEFVVSYKKSAAVSAASETGCNSEKILHNQNMMEEVIYHECKNTEKDETNNDNSDSIPEPNQSTHLMSDRKCVVVTVPNTNERGQKTRNVNIMFLLRCVLLFVFVLLCIKMML